MSATNKTVNYNLPLFLSTDVPTWLGDWNRAMLDIDSAIYNASQSGGGGSSIAVFQTTGNSTTGVMSQNATTIAIAAKQDALVSGQDIKTINGESILGPGNITISGGDGTTPTTLFVAGNTFQTDPSITNLSSSTNGVSFVKINNVLFVSIDLVASSAGTSSTTGWAMTFENSFNAADLGITNFPENGRYIVPVSQPAIFREATASADTDAVYSAYGSLTFTSNSLIVTAATNNKNVTGDIKVNYRATGMIILNA